MNTLPHASMPAPLLGTQKVATAARQWPWSWWIFALGIVFYMTLSPQGLLMLGVSYDAPGGAFFEKLHPGTWLIGLAWFMLLAENGNPLRVASAQMAAQPLLGGYIICITTVLLWALSRHGFAGAAFIVDTLIMPYLCVASLMMLDSQRRYQCLVMVLGLLALNTLIGIGESLAKARLIPYRISGEATETVEDIFRPSALLGHPLANAMITAVLLPAVLYLRIPMLARGLLMVLLWVGTLAFGGRTAFACATVFYGLYFLLVAVRGILQGRFSYAQITGGALVATLGTGIVTGAIFASGIGERIFKSIEWDGSAEVRARVYDVLDYLGTDDMLIGIPPTEVIAVGKRIGLGKGEAIENFWLVMFLQMGWIGFVPYLLGMGCILWWLWKSTRGAMRVAIPVFLVVASSSNSLITKTTVLAMLAVVVAITRKQPVPSGSRPMQRLQVRHRGMLGVVKTRR